MTPTPTLTRHPLREQTGADQRAAILATGNVGAVPREIIRIECACETMLGPQSIVEIDRKQVGWQCIARMASYCPHCQTILMFGLMVDRATGQRATRPIFGKRRVRGAKSIDRFLTKYPQCRGIVIQ